MKKFLKYLFVTIFLVLIILVMVFRNRIILSYNIIKNLKNINDPYSITTSLFNIDPIETMNYKDIIYKKSHGFPQKLDIYSAKKTLPKGSPVIVYVHGGSWSYGDKSIPKTISPLFDMLREQGYTIISTSYSLMKDKVIFDEQVEDVKDTIRWIRKNKDIYDLNSEEIGVIGTSAGAHLALLSSYTSDSQFIGDASLKDYSSKVKYVIDFFGPTDLSTLDLTKASPNLLKYIKSNPNTKELLNKYSPINYVKNYLPDTLIIHSKKDTFVPYRNSTLLYDKTKTTNSDVKLVTLENSDHDFSNISKEDIKSLAIEIFKFIIAHYPL